MKRHYLIALIPVLAIAPLLSMVRFIWCILRAPEKARQIAIGYDQLANVAMNGDPDETISSRAGRHARARERWACWLCGLLDKIDPNHCEKSVEKFTRQKK